MHSDSALLMTFVLALVAAFAGGLAARALRLPPIVGYLLGGLAVGPFTPGFVGDSEAMSQLAEVGVMFMMFGTGLHFSLRDLNEVKGIAVPGAVLQIAVGAAAGFALARSFGWTAEAGVMLGLSVSIASTVVLIKNLTDAGLYHTRGGRIATGWLIVEDLATVLVLVVLPVVFGPGEAGAADVALNIAAALVKTAVFVALMMVAGARALPWLLVRIARVCPRELFQLAVVVIALGTAVLASSLFGLSVALGAFLAGVVVSSSKLSHRVAAETIPFQDLFSIIFFASVGMMVDPAVLVAHAGELAALAALIMLGKWLANMAIGALFSAGAGVSLTVAAGLAQIGEFSFVIGQTGMELGVLSAEQYSLILGGAMVSIALNSFAFKAVPALERALAARPRLARLFNRRQREAEARMAGARPGAMEGHVVVVGYGLAGSCVADLMRDLGVPCLVVERDLATAEEAEDAGLSVLVGDAANSEILRHAHLDRARELVLAIRHEASAEKIAVEARAANPALRMVTRADSEDGTRAFVRAGVAEVVRPELEGGIELLRHVLLDLGFRPQQIQGYVDDLREDGYEALDEASRTRRIAAFERLAAAMVEVELRWVAVGEGGPCEGRALAEVGLRGRTGAQAVALRRGGALQLAPDPAEPLRAGDKLGIVGDAEALAAAEALLGPDPA